MSDITDLELRKVSIKSGAAKMISGMLFMYASAPATEREIWWQDVVALEALRDIMVRRIDEQIHAAATRSDAWLSDWDFGGEDAT